MYSLCELVILTHAALISNINGLLRVNDRLCEGPFTGNTEKGAANESLLTWSYAGRERSSQRPGSSETKQSHPSAAVGTLDPVINVSLR